MENYAEVDHWLKEFISRAPSPAAKLTPIWLKAYYDYFLGRWDESLAEYLELRKRAEEERQPFYVGVTGRILGSLYGDRGEFDAARASFQAYSDWELKRSPGFESTVKADQMLSSGLVDFWQGRLGSARAILAKLRARLSDVDPASRESFTYDFELLDAEVALAENNVDEAIRLREKITPRRFMNVTTADVANYNRRFLKDVLARAYWKKGLLDKASAEYEKLMTIDPKNQVRYLIHPLYHYRLGRVLEEKGDREKARLQYEKFLECWKTADAKHPEPADARRRLAALKSR
jgi:tetratricopeptide (TPR) repeat protein